MRTQILTFLCCFARFFRHISCDSCHAAINQIYIKVTEEYACTKILLLIPFNRRTLAGGEAELHRDLPESLSRLLFGMFHEVLLIYYT